MTGNVRAISQGHEWREQAAPCVHARASQQKELAWWSRGGVAGRPAWSRAVHDRKVQARDGALGYEVTARECGRANPRFEPTPHQGMKGPGCEAAMKSMKRVAGRSATLNRVVAEFHPAARGSSASR